MVAWLRELRSNADTICGSNSGKVKISRLALPIIVTDRLRPWAEDVTSCSSTTPRNMLGRTDRTLTEGVGLLLPSIENHAQSDRRTLADI